MQSACKYRSWRTEMKLYICEHCGNIITFIEDHGVPVVCCGERMHECIPNTTNASAEKHVPVIKVNNGTVTVSVGSAAHPMQPEHHIAWIALETINGVHLCKLKPETAPKATFHLDNEETVIAAYAYCNLHGFWKANA